MSEINSVNVFSVEEERLKFRVIIGCGVVAGAGNHTGSFEIIIPPPTNFANSSNYNQATLKLDSFIANPAVAVVGPTWTDNVAVKKLGALIVKVDNPSSQSTNIKINTDIERQEGGVSQIGGFRQLLPLQIVNVGNTVAATAAPGGYAWTGIGSGIAATDPILSGNPFGQKVKISLVDPITNKVVWLQDAAGGGFGGANIGSYTFQFTITMIPNDRGKVS